MKVVFDIFDEEKMSEPIGVVERRKVREIVNNLTCGPILTNQEYVNFMLWADKVCKRLESEETE